ncbi:hypothetical protein [Amycolatopsis sulphurea]|uniref:hypothetical protein n=1 Tax=Amycolatopsis sulphurea TaxID=76022 RepID=UPI000BF8703C|nr:hypothetical protein [Amycolatopsis sulphurea]
MRTAFDRLVTGFFADVRAFKSYVDWAFEFSDRLLIDATTGRNRSAITSTCAQRFRSSSRPWNAPCREPSRSSDPGGDSQPAWHVLNARHQPTRHDVLIRLLVASP